MRACPGISIYVPEAAMLRLKFEISYAREEAHGRYFDSAKANSDLHVSVPEPRAGHCEEGRFLRTMTVLEFL